MANPYVPAGSETRTTHRGKSAPPATGAAATNVTKHQRLSR